MNARTYGQIVFSTFLNIGESIGVPAYVKIIERQPPDVQQRIRDFLFYPIAGHVPKAQWKATLDENRQIYPGLFPKDFQFGHGDPVFAKGPNQAMQPTTGRRTLKFSMTPTSSPAATRALASGG